MPARLPWAPAWGRRLAFDPGRNPAKPWSESHDKETQSGGARGARPLVPLFPRPCHGDERRRIRHGRGSIRGVAIGKGSSLFPGEAPGGLCRLPAPEPCGAESMEGAPGGIGNESARGGLLGLPLALGICGKPERAASFPDLPKGPETGKGTDMKFALLLILTIHGQGEAWKLDSGLTREDCGRAVAQGLPAYRTGRGVTAKLVCREETIPPKAGDRDQVRARLADKADPIGNLISSGND